MDVVSLTQEHIKSLSINESTGHDWWHILRVYNLAMVIVGNYPEADMKVVQLAALLHDIADWKSNNGDFNIGAAKAKDWLLKFDDVTDFQIENIVQIVRNVSFKGKNARYAELSFEGKIVQDADRLDALGAVGIARTFAYGGSKGNVMYDPEIKPLEFSNENDYVFNKRKSTTINHFYEKLLLLKDLLHTEYARSLAIKRELFMKQFLDQFYMEWDGIR